MPTKTILRILFSCILLTLLAYTGWASTRQSVLAWGGLTTGPDRYWTIATMLDAYFGFITFYVWVFYKESRWLPRAAWFIAIMLFGNMAMATYVLIQLARLRADSPVAAMLASAIHEVRHVKNWLLRRIVDPLLNLLKQGIDPDRLALCVALGVVIGNIPILGVSTALCAVIALAFRLNLPAMQLVQALMAPTQLLLIIPYVRLGEWVLRAPPQPLSIKAGLALLQQGVGHAVVVLWDAILHAGFAFLLTAPLSIFLMYRILAPIFERAAARVAGRPPAGDPLSPSSDEG